eukprot:COSAG01_NODE_8169_length_2892_cov_24.795560_2_plen_134_part_00
MGVGHLRCNQLNAQAFILSLHGHPPYLCDLRACSRARPNHSVCWLPLPSLAVPLPPPPPPSLLLLFSAIGCGCGGLRRRECSLAPVPTGDDDHNVAVFQWAGRWGCLSVSNHASLRFRNPVYKTLRELTISYL